MLAPEKQADKRASDRRPTGVQQAWAELDLTFDVSVDDHVAVQVGHPLQDLAGVAPRHVFRQRSVRLQLVLNGALEKQNVSFPGGADQRWPVWRSTHARHVLHEDGQRPLGGVPKAAVVLHNPLVTEVLQQLDFTF